MLFLIPNWIWNDYEMTYGDKMKKNIGSNKINIQYYRLKVGANVITTGNFRQLLQIFHSWISHYHIFTEKCLGWQNHIFFLRNYSINCNWLIVWKNIEERNSRDSVSINQRRCDTIHICFIYNSNTAYYIYVNYIWIFISVIKFQLFPGPLENKDGRRCHLYLKRQYPEIFDLCFFHKSTAPRPLINTLKYFRILFRIRGAIRL
jgi:hypothetical protein